MRSRKKSKSFWSKWKWSHNNPKLLGHSQGSPETKVHSDTGLPKTDRNISNKKPNPTPITTGGITTKTVQSKSKEANKQDHSRIKWENKITIIRINKSRSLFFEKINTFDKPLIRLIRKKRERTQINTIRNERGEITTDTKEMQRIIRKYYQELYAKKFENLTEMDTFLEKYNILKLNEEEA